MRLNLLSGAVVAIALLAGRSADATILFSTGNQQYTNVNIAADVDALSIVGDIGNTGVHMTFDNMIGPDGVTQVTMHGQHGVAFVESYLDSLPQATHTGFSSLTLTPEAGYAFAAGDFSLDQLNSLANPTGVVSFVGIDQFGNPTLASFSISQNGQNPYNFTTANGEVVTSIVISVATTDLLQDIKQVSLDVVHRDGTPIPEPMSIALLGAGLAGLGMLRRRRG